MLPVLFVSNNQTLEKNHSSFWFVFMLQSKNCWVHNRIASAKIAASKQKGEQSAFHIGTLGIFYRIVGFVLKENFVLFAQSN